MNKVRLLGAMCLGATLLMATLIVACSGTRNPDAGSTRSADESAVSEHRGDGSNGEQMPSGRESTEHRTVATPSTTTTAPTPQYRFPIEPVSAASYQADHHDYPAADIFAECGTPVVSPTNGQVVHARASDRWNATDNNPAYRGGLSFAVLGVDGVRYYGSHLQRVDVSVGQKVAAGDPVGLVGRSGNAASTPCHLHFGISPTCPGVEWKVRRGALWPQPYLDDWAAGGASSPREEVSAWSQAHPDACEVAMADPTASLADT